MTNIDYEQILSEASSMRQDILNGIQKEELETKYKYLFTLPALFGSIIKDPSIERFENIKKMADMAKKVQNKTLTQFEASEQVGTALAEEYIYSVIPNFDKNKDLKKNQ